MKKRLISILVLVTMLFTLLPAQAIVVADNTTVDTGHENNQTKNPFTDVERQLVL